MSAGHPHREPHWLYDKAQRQKERAQDLAEYERLYREEAGLPEGPLDLLDQVGLEVALKTYELFMDRVFWGEGSGEMTGLSDVRKLAWYDPRPPVPHDPVVQRFFDDALAWFEDARFLPELRGTSPLERLRGSNGWGADVTWRRKVNLSRETMDLLASSPDRTLEYYGTSEHADPRGYWMPLDVQSADQGRETGTEA